MMPGLSVRREMQLLVDAGLTPMQAIQAATKWAAELLRQTKNLGTLEEGKLADLLILERDPLQEITAFKDVDLVMKDGEVMPRGYHYDFSNPIPEGAVQQLSYVDYVVSEIPTRITSISPPVAVEGSGEFTLTVKGKDFITSSIVQFGDTMLRTEFVDSAELKASVPAELLKKAGTYPVRVAHRAPGWGNTNQVSFFVKYK